MEFITPHITPEILSLIAEIDEFKGRWRTLKILSPEVLGELRKVATIESVGSSTRIEGARLSDHEVAALLFGLGADSFRSRDEEEVAGYAAAMEMIFASWETMPVTENHVRQLHQVLLRHSGKDERHRGDYKVSTNHVAAFDAEGRQLGVVFETATPFETPLEMEKLSLWLGRAERERTLHPLLITAIYVVWFLAIHPFQDGNGRLSRILTTLLLLRFGYSHVPYASLEGIVEASKGAYYSALRQTQVSLKSATPDWTPWVTFFLQSLVRQKNRLEEKISVHESRPVHLSSLSIAILDLLEAQLNVTVAGVVQAAGANRNTAKAALQALVSRGLIVRRGKGRGVYYTLYR